jgi:membrane protein insertase Oxa1/YidC/SpoIIIJ
MCFILLQAYLKIRITLFYLLRHSNHFETQTFFLGWILRGDHFAHLHITSAARDHFAPLFGKGEMIDQSQTLTQI